MQEFYIVDTTLRDGEQSAGVAFTNQEKIAIAALLDQVGVYQVEAGIPAMGKLEMEAIYSILSLNLKAKISTWNRANLSDIKASLDCGARNLHISAPVSDLHIRYKLNRTRLWVLEIIKRSVCYALDYGCHVTVGAEDASRADMDFLITYARLVRELGVSRLRFADTLGLLDPFTTREKITRLISEVGIDVEIHAHNDFGMATANTLAAYRAGARFLSTTVAGLGERAGNSSLSEVMEVLQKFSQLDITISSKVMETLTRFVAKAANRPELLASIRQVS